MIQFRALSLARGQRTLIEDANLSIAPNSKVGLVGANGSGKSSLFGLIRGHYESELGEVLIPKNLSISAIEQEVPSSEQSALDFVLDGHQSYRALQVQMSQAEKEERFDEVAHLYPQWEAIHAPTIPVQAKKILHGLGFSHDQMEWRVNQFSGGWRVRLPLAKTLINPGDLLLLDEPTNHLDLEAILWLEKWCAEFPGTLIIIAHDTVFLDNIVDSIVHLENRCLTFYKGNYSTFVRIRAEKIALNQKMREKQLKERAHLESFINRFKAKASKAKQAQSRVKRLEKMEDIAALHTASPFQFTFYEVDAPNPIVRVQKGTLGYDAPLLSNISFYLGPGDRIALLGKNGQGKSTFVKLLAQELSLMEGECHVAHGIKIGYFAQHQVEALPQEQTPYEFIQKQSQMEPQALRNFLGSFNFSDEKALSKIKVLSGGERARLSFASLVLQKPHLILLDEPTNHLDLEMREALSLALYQFNGALVVVSHDRAFIESCCDTLCLIDEGKVQTFDGTLQDYAQWATQKEVKPKQAIKAPKEDSFKLKKQLTNRVKKLEQDIESLSAKLCDYETQIADPKIYESSEKKHLDRLLKEQHDTQLLLQAKEQAWEEAISQLEEES